MDGSWIPILIVAIVSFAVVMKARYRYFDKHSAQSPAERAETLRLRDEVKQLKERLHTLERIAVDKENTLSRQIEELRDR